MRELKIILTLIIIGLSGCNEKISQKEMSSEIIAAQWYKIKYSEGNVEFQFPENRFIKSNDTAVVNGLGNVEINTWRLVYQKPDSSGNLGYSFSHYKYPEHIFEKSEITPFFDGVVENLKDAFNAQIIYNKKINYKGYEGREIYYLVPNQKLYFTERTYLIDGEQYAMSVLTEKNNLINASINKFLNSFKILE